jgi:NADH-quinone oxidoreductase subunit N
MVGVAAALMFVGLGFKVSGAPFQIWAPDVYQGAPAPVSAFMATGAQSRRLRHLPAHLPDRVPADCRRLGAAHLDLGAALDDHRQLRRADPDQPEAHAGLQFHRACRLHSGGAGGAVRIGTAAAMFYLAAYALMNIGAFAVVIHISGKGERHLRIEDLAGLAAQPFTAAMLTVFLLSLIGVPLTGGFFGKFYIFRAALESNLIWLTVLGLLNSAVAAYYYLRCWS